MPKVAVAAVNGFFGIRDGDAARFSVIEGIFARADFPFAPRGDHFDARIECHHGQLEADLVVPFAGCAVSNRLRPDFMRHIDEMFGYQRTGDGRAE